MSPKFGDNYSLVLCSQITRAHNIRCSWSTYTHNHWIRR